jgi:hypothetical protein
MEADGAESGVVCGFGGAGARGPVEQAASVATIAAATSHRSPLFMGLILLEAFAALAALVLIVWWTMFSGRRRGEIDDASPDADDASARADASDKDRPPRG